MQEDFLNETWSSYPKSPNPKEIGGGIGGGATCNERRINQVPTKCIYKSMKLFFKLSKITKLFLNFFNSN